MLPPRRKYTTRRVPFPTFCALSGKGRTTGLSDGVHESPSLVRLLSSDTLDDTCRVRLWVEQRSDGGFWEVERDPPRWQPLARPGPRCGAAAIAAAVKVAASPQAPATSTPTSPKPPKESFAGVRLSCTADMPPWEMRSALGWGPRAWSPADPGPPGATGGVAVAPTPGNANDVEVLLSSAAVVPGGGEEQQPENAAAVGGVQSGTAGGGGGLSPVRRRREERILVFLKTLGLSGGGGGVGKGSRGGVRGKGGDYGGTGDSGSSDGGRDGEGGAVYLTHAVLRKTSPLRSLFELAAEIFPQCVAAEELGAYVEELPCMWQGVPVEAFGSEAVRARLFGDEAEAGGGGGERENTFRSCCSCVVRMEFFIYFFCIDELVQRLFREEGGAVERVGASMRNRHAVEEKETRPAPTMNVGFDRFIFQFFVVDLLFHPTKR